MLIICDQLWTDGFSRLVEIADLPESGTKTRVLSYGVVKDIPTSSHYPYHLVTFGGVLGSILEFN